MLLIQSFPELRGPGITDHGLVKQKMEAKWKEGGIN
jgi:hypothetical protein